MFALIGRHDDGRVWLALTQDQRSDALWYRDEYRRRWPGSEWIVCPFLRYVDQRRSSGSNPHPKRDDFRFEDWL